MVVYFRILRLSISNSMTVYMEGTEEKSKVHKAMKEDKPAIDLVIFH